MRPPSVTGKEPCTKFSAISIQLNLVPLDASGEREVHHPGHINLRNELHSLCEQCFYSSDQIKSSETENPQELQVPSFQVLSYFVQSSWMTDLMLLPIGTEGEEHSLDRVRMFYLFKI